MQRRLFFALPAQSVASALHHCQQQLHEEGHRKPVNANNFHLTLHFLGMQDEHILPQLYQVAAELRSPPFELTLDQYGLFRHAHCLWLGPQHPAPPLLHLVNRLGESLTQLGLPVSTDYRPHITLFRNARAMTKHPAPALRLQVSEFILYESISAADGVWYKPLRRWPLLNQSVDEKQQ